MSILSGSEEWMSALDSQSQGGGGVNLIDVPHPNLVHRVASVEGNMEIAMSPTKGGIVKNAYFGKNVQNIG